MAWSTVQGTHRARLEKQITSFINHEPVMIRQTRLLKYLTLNIGEGETVIHCDFSENFAAKAGTEIQSFYFRRKKSSSHFTQLKFTTSHNSSSLKQGFPH